VKRIGILGFLWKEEDFCGRKRVVRVSVKRVCLGFL
jgi:hypothetical protein